MLGGSKRITNKRFSKIHILKRFSNKDFDIHIGYRAFFFFFFWFINGFHWYFELMRQSHGSNPRGLHGLDRLYLNNIFQRHLVCSY